jgi:hypothetical protein
VKVRETEIAGWTVFHLFAPLDVMKLQGERVGETRTDVKIQGFGNGHKS